MLPNLTLIVAVYVVIRLATMALRQFPEVEKAKLARWSVAGFAVLAIGLVVLCTLDTIGVGLSLGSSIDQRR